MTASSELPDWAVGPELEDVSLAVVQRAFHPPEVLHSFSNFQLLLSCVPHVRLADEKDSDSTEMVSHSESPTLYAPSSWALITKGPRISVIANTRRKTVCKSHRGVVSGELIIDYSFRQTSCWWCTQIDIFCTSCKLRKVSHSSIPVSLPLTSPTPGTRTHFCEGSAQVAASLWHCALFENLKHELTELVVSEGTDGKVMIQECFLSVCSRDA